MRLRALTALSALLAVFAPVALARTPATLSLVERTPLTIHGKDFVASERIHVTVEARRRIELSTRANRGGGFTVRFEGLDVPRCGGVLATARGRRGSFARLKIPLPACLPVAQP